MRAIRRHKRGLLDDDRGTSMVEFALTAPFLVLLALGLIEVGRYTAYSVVVGNAVRAGATVGAVSQAVAEAPPDPNQLNSSNMDYLASQTACNDAIQSLKVGDPSFSCTSKGSIVPTNALLITSSFSCTYSDGIARSGCALPPTGVTRNMFITVSAAGKFKSLLNYPLLPKSAPVSAQTTIQVTE
ncbi:MAG TPA: TadE/TadG family type IV pilus assembly protein [Candidatus Tumulicola sp.]|nr:TadE/TadG family type IV pilus assembly protein [Candidatus Tumulicola sp.]